MRNFLQELRASQAECAGLKAQLQTLQSDLHADNRVGPLGKRRKHACAQQETDGTPTPEPISSSTPEQQTASSWPLVVSVSVPLPRPQQEPHFPCLTCGANGNTHSNPKRSSASATVGAQAFSDRLFRHRVTQRRRQEHKHQQQSITSASPPPPLQDLQNSTEAPSITCTASSSIIQAGGDEAQSRQLLPLQAAIVGVTVAQVASEPAAQKDISAPKTAAKLEQSSPTLTSSQSTFTAPVELDLRELASGVAPHRAQKAPSGPNVQLGVTAAMQAVTSPALASPESTGTPPALAVSGPTTLLQSSTASTSTSTMPRLGETISKDRADSCLLQHPKDKVRDMSGSNVFLN